MSKQAKSGILDLKSVSLAPTPPDAAPDVPVCCGCGCCLLACPVWRLTGDVTLTAHGRAMATGWGASVEEMAEAIDECRMCGACEPICTEQNKLLEMTLEQRGVLNASRATRPNWYPNANAKDRSAVFTTGKVALFAGEESFSDEATCRAIIGLLAGRAGRGDRATSDALPGGVFDMLEAGLVVTDEVVAELVGRFDRARTVVTTDGGALRHLRKWLPRASVIGLGEALLKIAAVRKRLGPGDMYVIDSRPYHLDFERLVKFYDRVVKETGMQTNLDLNRLAATTGAWSLISRHDIKGSGALDEARRILGGRDAARIVTEDPFEAEAFRRVSDAPVVTLGDIAKEVTGR